MTEARLRVLHDLLRPGVRMWQGRGSRVRDLTRHGRNFFVTLDDGSQRLLLHGAEVEDGSFKTLFGERMRELACEP